jgi:hypothetical protein
MSDNTTAVEPSVAVPQTATAPTPAGKRASEEHTVELRVEALREAATIISSDRNKSYGGPEENFDRIAKLWTMLFGVEFSQEDVAMAMIAVKMARYMNRDGGFQRDTWIDIAGYAGCGYEVGYKAAQG